MNIFSTLRMYYNESIDINKVIINYKKIIISVCFFCFVYC